MLLGIRHTYSPSTVLVNTFKRRALIVSIRTVSAAILAAIISVSMPVFVSAEGATPPQPPAVVESSSGSAIWDWMSGKAGEVKQAAVNKWQDKTDPEHKVANLTERNAALVAENEVLRRKAILNDERKLILTSDRESMEAAIRTLHVLFATGRMSHLFSEVPNAEVKPEVTIPTVQNE